MTKRVITEAQDYLTVVEPDHTYQIVNVELLLWRHSPDEVVGFLKMMRSDYKKELRALLRENKVHPKINFLIVHIFRVRMAIKTILKAQKEARRESEHEIEPRAAGSSGLS